MTHAPSIPLRPIRRVPLLAALASAFFLTAALRAEPAPPADLVRLATAALADGMPQLAEEYLVKYLAFSQRNSSPADSRHALALLCRAYAGQGRHSEIPGLLDKNADLVAAGDTRPFDYWRAYAALHSDRPADALALIDPDTRLAVRTNDTANLRLARLAAEAYSRLDTADARSRAEEMVDFFLRAAPRTDPALPLSDAQLLRARLFVRRGAREEAASALNAIADDEKANAFVRANALLELVTLAETNATAALAFADRLAGLPLGKAAPDYLIPCGRLLASRPATTEVGARRLKGAIRDNPASPLAPDAQFALADAWLSVGSNELAAAEFKTYLETYGTTPEQTSRATAGRAEALYRLGDFTDAATLFQKAAQTAETAESRAIYTMRGADALHAEGKYESAIPLYRTVLQSAFTSPSSFGLLSRFYRDAPADAGLDFIHPRCQFQTADSLERSGEAKQALEEFMLLADESGPFAEEARYRAALLQERHGGVGADSSAIANYTALISSTTNAFLRGLALLGRGRCHYRRKSLEVAIDDFRNAGKGDFDFADEARLYHIYALYALGRDDEAIRLADDFAARSKTSPVLPTLAFWRAQYHYNRREFDQARTRFLDFAAQWPNDSRTPLALLWAAKTALQLSDNQGAVDTLATLGQRRDADALLPEARYTQATALCNLARFEDAVLVLDDALAKFPSSDFTTRSLILKGDALFSLSGSAKTGHSVTNAISAYDIASTRADATVDQRLECNYKRARCLEKAGDAQGAVLLLTQGVIHPYYALADDGGASPQAFGLYERAASACARLLELRGDVDGALGLLRRLASFEQSGREPILREIERLQNIRK